MGRPLEPRRADVIPGGLLTPTDTTEAVGSADTKLRVLVKLVLAGGTGQQEVSEALPKWVVQVLRDVGSERPHGRSLPRALDVPVLVEQGSDRIARIDQELLLQEWEPFREEATAVWKRDFGLLSPVRAVAAAPKGLLRGLRSVKDQLGAHLADIRSDEPAPSSPRPTTETHPPVEGVDYDTWVRAMLAGDPVTPGAQAAWMAMAKRDPVVGEWYRWDVQHLGRS